MSSPPHVPGFELDRELGRGAYSVVYGGLLGSTPCALKVPLVAGGWTRWVHREAVALARVRAPGLPMVLEVGEADGLPYLAMELIEGQTLADVIAAGPLREPMVLDLAIQLAETLGSVHDAGLVHRDVKPRNLILEGGSLLRLVDFGFATPIERAGETSDAAGTPAYAAPEQLREPARVDARADLYAMGRVLHECLTGRPAPVDASRARAELVARGRSPSLSTIVAGLLPLDRDARYPDAQAALADLRLARGGRPVRGPAGHPPSPRGTPFVGRAAEIDTIARGWAAVSHGRGAAQVLVGARGAGKSRVLRAAVARWRDADRGPAVVAGCREGDAPLAVLRRLLASLSDPGTEGSAGEDLGAAMRACAGDDLAPLAALIAPSLAAGAPATGGAVAPGTFAEGAAELILRLARRAGPLLAAVDDAQWADPVSLEVLQCLAHRVQDAPLVLLISMRSETRAVASWEGIERVRMLALEPFDSARIEQLVAAHLGHVRPDPGLLRRIDALADHTPLGVLEMVGALLDAGALRPRRGAWILDCARAERAALPEATTALIRRRLGEMPPATRRVLEAAAVIGATFEEALLAGVVGVAADDIGFGLLDARRAGLVESDGARHRFVHDSVRETLLGGMAPARLEVTHLRVADALEARGGTSQEELCRVADHLARGPTSEGPLRLVRAANAAGAAALGCFDNETALRFLELAQRAAAAAHAALAAEDDRRLGEVHLRMGNLAASKLHFERALAHSTDHRARAELLGRIAWVHQADNDPEGAWIALERAFDALGHRMPRESARAAIDTAGHLLARAGRRLFPRSAAGVAGRESELLCDLHYQNARLGMEHGRPLRLIESTVQALELSETLGPSPARARSLGLAGLVSTALGRRNAGARQLERAATVAREVADPATSALCVQLRSAAACWAGDLDEGMRLARECIETHGHLLELTEICLNSLNADLILTARGKPRQAWAFAGRAFERLMRSRHPPLSMTHLILERACAARTALGEPTSDLRDAAARLHDGPRPEPRGFPRLATWGSRALGLLEHGDLGAEFEDLVRRFEAERHNPRTVHMVASEYYVAVAHARIELCLRAPAADRRPGVADLRRATADLRAVAKIPLLVAHARLAEAHIQWLGDSPRAARKALAEAEELAVEQSCPWVTHGVARARAHILREAGRLDAARDQARVAALLAREHGAEPRARRVEDEFGVVAPVTPVRSASTSTVSARSSQRARRHLTALLQVVRAGARDVDPERQAIAVIDELVRDLDAERGTLWFQPDTGLSTRLVLGRSRAGATTFEAEGFREALLQVARERGEPATGDVASLLAHAEVPDPDRTLAVPLMLYGRAVGAMCFERSRPAPAFGAEERDLLGVLAQQVPLALELARLLGEREQLHASLQQAQKMEAVGQLAGGVAHDFNNMLTAIQASLELLGERLAGDDEASLELDVAVKATARAAQLTRQLLTFSRHQPVPLTEAAPSAMLEEIEPVLRRLVGSRVTLELACSSTAGLVKADRAAFEQALVNLVVNARDAMPNGGTVTITTADVTLDASHVRRGAPAAGDYTTVAVRDTGQGMPPELVSRVFEPFFTTKAAGAGTGLGLTMVYAFVKNCGGHIEVVSEPEVGTTFLLHLPRAAEPAAGDSRLAPPLSPPPPAEGPPSSGSLRRGAETVLVIDDERLVSRSIQKMLERSGYRVLVAHSAEVALELVTRRGDEIALVILDMLMPDMSGPELGRRFIELQLPAKLLYISGYAPESLPTAQREGEAASFLQKPFTPSDLLGRVGALLES